MRPFYRVSHLKLYKVIWLCWGYRFWFLLIFLVLHVHEIGPFMPNSSVFIFLMLRALYRMICKSSKKIFAKKSLNVTNVKLLSNFFFNSFRYFYAFFDFHLWFKVKMYIFYGLLHFITWERPLKVKIAQNLLWNMRSWLIDP